MRPAGSDRSNAVPRVIAWEITRSCPLNCRHCRAAAQNAPYEGELTTDEGRRLLESIAAFAKPILILTGGEPLLREDVYELASCAGALGLRTAVATCGALLTADTADRLKAAGVGTISISIDGATAATHDAFRGTPGAFEAGLRGIEIARKAGLDVQVNTTVTKDNAGELADILALAIDAGARVFNPFLLVPTGRGRELADREMSPAQYERTLRWLAEQRGAAGIGLRVTCAPHYQRSGREIGADDAGMHGGGCLGGKSFAFISHRGIVQCCGFLDVPAGDLRTAGMDFRRAWEDSPLFAELRDTSGYHGRCGACEYVAVCGGCRARAYATTGDVLDEEPFCLHTPRARLDDQDKRVLSVVQAHLPVAAEPFDLHQAGIDVSPADVLARLKHLVDDGVIRRLGPVFDSRRLGYVSTLVAAEVPADRLDEVAAAVNELAGVTHNYSRDGAVNLWFTLTAESEQALTDRIDALAERARVAFHRLPSRRVFKIRVDFQLTKTARTSGQPTKRPPSEPAELTEEDKAVIRRLQEGLPLVERPFEVLAGQLGLSEQALLSKVADWLEGGVIRRFGAVVNHRRLGFVANGMAVFAVPSEWIETVGRAIAEHAEVSHCYERPTMPGFGYNLYAMVHGRTQAQVRAVVDAMAAEVGIDDYTVLFSTVEYKKRSMAYFV